jgi:hypothetical protein
MAFIGGFSAKLNEIFKPADNRRVMARSAQRVPLTFPAILTGKAFPSFLTLNEPGVYKYVFNGQHRPSEAFAITPIADVLNEHFDLAKNSFGMKEGMILRLKQEPNRDLVAGTFNMLINKSAKTVSIKINSNSFCFPTRSDYLESPVKALEKMMFMHGYKNVRKNVVNLPGGKIEYIISASLPE